MTQDSSVFDQYYEALCDLDQESANSCIDAALANQENPQTLLMNIVLPSFEKLNNSLVVEQEINLAQHYLSAKISEQIAMKLMGMFSCSGESNGIIILGTAIGDYHGLGKKIVAGCLRANLFTVLDAGTNVSPEQFVDLAVEKEAQVIAISSMMVHTATGSTGPLGVRKILHERRLEKTIKLMVGGAPFRFDHILYKKVKADGWGVNGLAAVATAKRLVKEVMGS